MQCMWRLSYLKEEAEFAGSNLRVVAATMIELGKWVRIARIYSDGT